MFDNWCDIEEDPKGGKKTLFKLSELNGGRAAVADQLVQQVRSHYEILERIKEDIDRLGYPGAAAILTERLPTQSRARSGEMGEILATEFVEHQTGFRIPVRRLRYKDGREMALRGDDFLGVTTDEQDDVYLLKGESKSGQAVTDAVISTARERLNDDDGRPTPISLLFVADRLLESGGDDEQLGRELRDEVALKAVPKSRTTHGIFILSGNDPTDDLENDLETADDDHNHLSANLRIDDHQDFIAWAYEEAGNLGDD